MKHKRISDLLKEKESDSAIDKINSSFSKFKNMSKIDKLLNICVIILEIRICWNVFQFFLIDYSFLNILSSLLSAIGITMLYYISAYIVSDKDTKGKNIFLCILITCLVVTAFSSFDTVYKKNQQAIEQSSYQTEINKQEKISDSQKKDALLIQQKQIDLNSKALDLLNNISKNIKSEYNNKKIADMSNNLTTQVTPEKISIRRIGKKEIHWYDFIEKAIPFLSGNVILLIVNFIFSIALDLGVIGIAWVKRG